MKDKAIDLLFSMNPHIKDIPNIRKFFRKGLHLKFEQADTNNRIDWFESANEKHGECMRAHANCVKGVFDMDNYWNWCESKK